MKIPYGIGDYHALRTEGYLYVDRTGHIPKVEGLGKSLLFLRPRRFGKTLWLRTLSCYYDLRYAGEHERLFGGLAIAGNETPLAHRYFVLEWDFSKVNPDPPPRGVNAGVASRHERIGNEIHGYLRSSVKSFVSDFREHLPQAVDIEPDGFHTLNNLLAAIRQTPYKLYLLIDEYDNFANEVMTVDPDTYRELVHTDGPFKFLFKWVKSATAGQGLDRLFITGVSPLVMSDVTSGLNIARGVYLHPELAELCGFTDAEVDELLARIAAERPEGDVAAAEAKTMVREWYNGYSFASDAQGKIYNPTLALYFLLHLQEQGTFPDQMLDSNLAVDEGKLEYLGQVASGQEAVIGLIRDGKPLEIRRLEERFTLQAMLTRSAQDATFLGSYLYYFGMLTLSGKTSRRTLELSPPNLVVQGLYVDQIRKFLLPLGRDRSAAEPPSLDVTEGKAIEPLLDFIETSVFTTFSNRDSQGADELMVKTVFVCLLWNEINYVMLSEPELGRGYADLCLLRRPDARDSSLWDLLFEFKRLPLGDLGITGEEVRNAPRDELAAIARVSEALDDAERQIHRYRQELGKRHGDDLRLRAWAVVALGFDRLVARRSDP
jgi:hypothetical protein